MLGVIKQWPTKTVKQQGKVEHHVKGFNIKRKKAYEQEQTENWKAL